MERALAYVEGTERAKRLVEEAGHLATGVDAELILLHVTTEEEFEREHDALASVHEFDVQYGVASARDGARKYAQNLGKEVLGDDADFEAVGALGETVERILEVADRRECDHLFVPGRRRSPAGKALFGDVAQDVLLEFDGPVTVMTSGEVAEE